MLRGASFIAMVVAGFVLALASGASAAIFWVNSDNNSIGAGNLGKSRATSVNLRITRKSRSTRPQEAEEAQASLERSG